MIVVRRGGRLIVTTQPDHAVLSAELLALWRIDGLPAHPRRRELLFAAREHDNGWREADSAPRVDPATGRPHTFQTIPWDLRSEIWLRGVRRFLDRQPYASLLIAEHASHLLGDHRGHPEWREFFEALDAAREALVEDGSWRSEDVLEDYGYLELVDLLSLAVCSDWQGPFDLRGARFAVEGDALLIEPFPLAGTTTFVVRFRSIPDRSYGGDGDLGVEVATARWQDRRIQVRPF